MNENVLPALLLTTLAGLSTGIGSVIALFAKKTNTKFLSASLGFSSGVMIYVSLIELFPAAVKAFSLVYSEKRSVLFTVLSFLGGMLLFTLLERLIPGPSLDKAPRREGKKQEKKQKLYKTGIVTAVALALHNFPEGLATFVSALQGVEVAIPIVVAIALHNIPEGIAVSVPIYYATGSRKKAFLYSFLSGLTEPLAAILGYLILMPFLSDQLYAALNGMIAGIMVLISLDELLPAANRYGHQRLSTNGLIGGMTVMAFSLIGFM